MIRCDLEGVSGEVSYEQIEPGKPEYSFGLRMFRADLVACVEGLLEGAGATAVWADYWQRKLPCQKSI
jgi:D-aminopeptidase